jgi:hypothetical protein
MAGPKLTVCLTNGEKFEGAGMRGNTARMEAAFRKALSNGEAITLEAHGEQLIIPAASVLYLRLT